MSKQKTNRMEHMGRSVHSQAQYIGMQCFGKKDRLATIHRVPIIIQLDICTGYISGGRNVMLNSFKAALPVSRGKAILRH